MMKITKFIPKNCELNVNKFISPFGRIYETILTMKEKKTFKFTTSTGWASTIKGYGILWAVTQLKNRGHDVKKIEEISG